MYNNRLCEFEFECKFLPGEIDKYTGHKIIIKNSNAIKFKKSINSKKNTYFVTWI